MPRSSRTRPDTKRVVGYIRVSTTEQALGPEAQLAALRSWCSARGADLVAVHSDLGVSGGAELDKRPGLLAALDALREHGAGVLLVAKRDRLARDVVIAAMAERLAARRGAEVQSADGAGNGSGPADQLMRTMVDAFAQYERALIRARTSAALRAKRARGERTGGVARLGERLAPCGVRVEPEPAEVAALGRIAELHAEGATVRAIAARLNAEGVPSRGSKWHATTVARALRRLERREAA